MASTISTVQVDNLSIIALDASGNQVSPVTFDSAPTWSLPDSSIATIAASGDGTTATVTPVAVGTTTVTLSCAVGGAVFTATLDVTVTDSGTGTIVASVQIAAVPAPKP